MRVNHLICLTLLAINMNSYAGFAGLTTHSRANCANNESITWHFGHSYRLLTYSAHIDRMGYMHEVKAAWANTWRSAAVHWFEAKPGSGYNVIGNHFWFKDGKRSKIRETLATDCAIYDGWWFDREDAPHAM